MSAQEEIVCDLGRFPMDHLLENIQNSPQLRILSVFNGPLLYPNLKRILDSISTTSHLRYLMLSDLFLQNESAVSIAEFLKSNTSITNVDLDFNSFTDIGLIALYDSIFHNTRIIELNLCGCRYYNPSLVWKVYLTLERNKLFSRLVFKYAAVKDGRGYLKRKKRLPQHVCSLSRVLFRQLMFEASAYSLHTNDSEV